LLDVCSYTAIAIVHYERHSVHLNKYLNDRAILTTATTASPITQIFDIVESMHKHVTIIVEGMVQGVSFRVSAKEFADSLNLAGYVINQPDGSVFVVVEGEESALQKMIDWCKCGPEHASVQNVTIHEGELKNLTEFTIEGS
jgi:acylphosphatase